MLHIPRHQVWDRIGHACMSPNGSWVHMGGVLGWFSFWGYAETQNSPMMFPQGMLASDAWKSDLSTAREADV